MSIIEQVQLNFLKIILTVKKKKTPNCIVYGETGVMPLKLDIQSRIVAYWYKLVHPEKNKLSSKLYWFAKSYYENRPRLSFKRLISIRNIFINYGCSGIWEIHPLLNKIWLVKTIK